MVHGRVIQRSDVLLDLLYRGLQVCSRCSVLRANDSQGDACWAASSMTAATSFGRDS